MLVADPRLTSKTLKRSMYLKQPGFNKDISILIIYVINYLRNKKKEKFVKLGPPSFEYSTSYENIKHV